MIYQHLKDRHIDIKLHRPVIDFETEIVTFYLYNLSGQIVGYQQYNHRGEKNNKKSGTNNKLTGKYFTYTRKDTVSVFGIESLKLTDGPVFITEGLFDAARLTERGQSAIAMLANNPPRDYGNFLAFLNRPIVAVCDNDAAGRKLAKYGDYIETTPDSKDLSDASDDYVNYLIQKYSTPVPN